MLLSLSAHYLESDIRGRLLPSRVTVVVWSSWGRWSLRTTGSTRKFAAHLGWRSIVTDNEGKPVGWQPDGRQYEVATSASLSMLVTGCDRYSSGMGNRSVTLPDLPAESLPMATLNPASGNQLFADCPTRRACLSI